MFLLVSAVLSPHRSSSARTEPTVTGQLLGSSVFAIRKSTATVQSQRPDAIGELPLKSCSAHKTTKQDSKKTPSLEVGFRAICNTCLFEIFPKSRKIWGVNFYAGSKVRHPLRGVRNRATKQLQILLWHLLAYVRLNIIICCKNLFWHCFYEWTLIMNLSSQKYLKINLNQSFLLKVVFSQRILGSWVQNT